MILWRPENNKKFVFRQLQSWVGLHLRQFKKELYH